MKKSITFLFEKETKGTIRFQEAGAADTHTIGTLYIRKSALDGLVPKTVTIDLEAV